MSNLTPNVVESKSEQPEKSDPLILIEGHLRSIRSMLQFFVVLTILAIVIQACSVLM